MPSTNPYDRSKRDSWPPTRVHLRPQTAAPEHDEEDLDLAALNEDPLTFFLTPAPSVADEDADTDMALLDFLDAGIEDNNHPRQIVRSISPSSLSGGLNRSPPRSPPRSPLSLPRASTPPRSPPLRRCSPDRESDHSSMADDDDDAEDYIRFAPGGDKSLRPQFALPMGLREFAKVKARKDGSLAVQEIEAPLRPTSPRNAFVRRSSARAWRSPSPDVWSIEEEKEDEEAASRDTEMTAVSEGGQKQARPSAIRAATAPVDIPAARLKKKVRFVLPREEA